MRLGATLLQCDHVLVTLCNNPIAKGGHILRFCGLGFPQTKFGGAVSPAQRAGAHTFPAPLGQSAAPPPPFPAGQSHSRAQVHLVNIRRISHLRPSGTRSPPGTLPLPQQTGRLLSCCLWIVATGLLSLPLPEAWSRLEGHLG